MKYLCLGPSSLGSFGILGYLSAIEHQFADLEEISGCSAGAIIGFLYIIHRSFIKVFDCTLEVDIKDFTKANIENFLITYGLVSHEKIKNYFLKISNDTFKEFYEKYKIKFHVSTYCIEKETNEIFSVDTHPDTIVADAICMSISIPLLFSAFKYGDHHYIDGGTFETVPVTPFLNKEPDQIIIVKIFKNFQVDKQIDNIKDFLMRMFISIMKRTSVDYDNVTPNIHIVDFDDNTIFNFSGITYDEKVKMFVKGHQRALTHSGLAR